ncbi:MULTISPECIES: helix-turn-helix transcriptional regulator [Bacillales]|uniref:helix-turn-helix domain-containing protein n=1 Tax=Bacillales TaxID=1385 RepID=UPI00195D8264|nr:helix-turn-helix transcriptional regulator [Gracilibacillus alcaliphilus]MBM7676103.1 DNA-binding Xre family transcriptional regulator [Gracilibacillus alcaliphilus]
MGVSYKRLWKLIIDKDMTKAQVRKECGIAASTFSKMNKNEYVSLEILERICKKLDCNIGDIVEIDKK